MVTLAEAKQQVRLFGADTEDDDEITRMIAAAVDHLSSLGVNMDADALPPALHQATLLIVADLYGNRGDGEDPHKGAIQPAVARLITPYRSITI